METSRIDRYYNEKGSLRAVYQGKFGTGDEFEFLQDFACTNSFLRKINPSYSIRLQKAITSSGMTTVTFWYR